ncbi:MAG: MotA/TolQ/Exb proton channel [Desulfobacteraceae bacterium 4572_123]|nr:MAG: MotA/TolQ/Exb proton channel [Desulfobacteraceae bacterium 4572_123]
MKRILSKLFFLCLCLCLSLGSAHADDMRAASMADRQKKADLLQKAALEKQMAQQEAEKSRKKILSDKKALQQAIRALKAKKKKLAGDNEQYRKKIDQLAAEKEKLTQKRRQADAASKELAGFIKIAAGDLDGLLDQSQQSAFAPTRQEALKPLKNQTRFPGMDDIRAMIDLYFDEIQKSGEVRLTHGPMVDRSGEDVSGDILVLGNFTTAYRIDKEIGFLIYSDKSHRLFALSKPPSARIKKNIARYMAGESENIFMDISRGSALRQLTHRLSLADQIKSGGPIVWPILGVGILAMLIVLERLFSLTRKGMNADRLMKKITGPASERNWDACGRICAPYRHKSIAGVLLQGTRAACATREDMENVMQEAILREIPSLERFLSTLGMLAGIAPLLGLLGTVTGMINTFHVITYFGTGDPKMMSGGISEALVTTMLGLAVAIPIMLCHTFLSRRVETLIGQMEEKSVTFINTLFKGAHTKS